MNSVQYKIFQRMENGKEVLWGIGDNSLEKALGFVQYIVDSSYSTADFYIEMNGATYSFKDFCELCNVSKRSFEERIKNTNSWIVWDWGE